MATNLEKLHQAGIVGVPHVISPDDESAINSLSDAEVDTLIAVKAKLEGSASAKPTALMGPPPVGTMSF